MGIPISDFELVEQKYESHLACMVDGPYRVFEGFGGNPSDDETMPF